jgi:hypothetical protein
MGFKHPTLITDAPPTYFGWRAETKDCETVVGKRAKYTYVEIYKFIGRGQSAWLSWRKGAGLPIGESCIPVSVDIPNRNSTPATDMPYPLSAYMTLMDDAHPTYVLRARDTGRLPARPQACDKKGLNKQARLRQAKEAVVRTDELRLRHELDDAAIRAAFAFEPHNRQHSVQRVGVDPVRFAMLQLMCDEHPAYVVERRPHDQLAEPGEVWAQPEAEGNWDE